MFRILYRLLASMARLAVRSGRSKDLEIISLRHQLAVLNRQTDRSELADDDRSLLGAIAQALPRFLRTGWLVTPDTLLRWHRRRVARHWTQPHRPPGRPSTANALRQLVIEMATNNPTLGISPHPRRTRQSRPSRRSVHHLENPQNQPHRSSTRTLHGHLDPVPTVPCREVFFAGITPNPTGPWTTQAVRNLFVRHSDRLTKTKALERDRGSQFIDSFDEVFRTEGFKILKTPVRTPVANALAERWIRSVRRELLDRTIIWNQHQLERLVVDYIAHYSEHRPHRSLDQRDPPLPTETSPHADPPRLHLIKSTRCDGLIHEYRNAA